MTTAQHTRLTKWLDGIETNLRNVRQLIGDAPGTPAAAGATTTTRKDPARAVAGAGRQAGKKKPGRPAKSTAAGT